MRNYLAAGTCYGARKRADEGAYSLRAKSVKTAYLRPDELTGRMAKSWFADPSLPAIA
jgi:hypothetical protein